MNKGTQTARAHEPAEIWRRGVTAARTLFARFPRVDLTPKLSIGIAFGCREVCAVRLSASRDGWMLDDRRQEKLDVPLFRGAPPADATARLAATLDRLCGGMKRRFVPIRVSLPDALGDVSVFELEALPKGQDAQTALVRWRFARERYGDDRELACASQALGTDRDKHLLLGLAMDPVWLTCLRQAFDAARIVPWSLNFASCYRFNRFYPLLTGDGLGGALVALDPDVWTLVLWDAHGRLRAQRSRWRASIGQDNLHDTLASETERFIRAYVHGGADRRVDRVYVAGGDETVALAAALDRRLRERCVPLAAGTGQAPADEGGKPFPGLMETALAAAAV